MVYMPNFASAPEGSAVKRFEAEFKTQRHGARASFAAERITIGQLIAEAGLGGFIQALDNPTFHNATPEKRHEMVITMLAVAGRMTEGVTLAPVAAPAPVEAAPLPPEDTTKVDAPTVAEATPEKRKFIAPSFAAKQ